jgi:hypothetical protein
MQITPQLMALGYATGKACLPDHTGACMRSLLNTALSHIFSLTGVYPPTDRISVLTCKPFSTHQRVYYLMFLLLILQK